MAHGSWFFFLVLLLLLFFTIEPEYQPQEEGQESPPHEDGVFGFLSLLVGGHGRDAAGYEYARESVVKWTKKFHPQFGTILYQVWYQVPGTNCSDWMDSG